MTAEEKLLAEYRRIHLFEYGTLPKSWAVPGADNYSNDWAYLMPVIAKIERLGFWTECRTQLGGTRFVIGSEKDANYNHPPIVNTYMDLKIDAMYAGVVKFVYWYEENQKP